MDEQAILDMINNMYPGGSSSNTTGDYYNSDAGTGYANNYLGSGSTDTSGSGSGSNYLSSLFSGGSGLWPALSTGSGLLSSYLGSSAMQTGSQNAVKAIQDAAAQASGTQSQMFDKSIALGQPYRDMAASAMPLYQQTVAGNDPYTQQLASMQGDQGLYDWQNKEVTRNVNNQLSARGRYDSGAGLRTLSDAYSALSAQQAQTRWDRATQLANTNYGRLNDMMNLGIGNTSQAAGLMTSQGNSLANTYQQSGALQSQPLQNAGNASASMYSNGNNAVQSGLSNLNSYMQG